MPRRSIAQTLILSCSGVSFDGVGAYAARRFFATRLFVVLCALLAALPESSTTFASLYGMRARRSHSAVRLTMCARIVVRSEEHTSELQSLMRISYAVFCLKKK